MFVQSLARAHGLTGLVRNLCAGTTVEVVAEGHRAQLQVLLAQLHVGPPGSHVERVDVSWGAATGGYEDFAVR